uniref:Uncharacterized protein n=1 Tax=Avena sativa TaxID=4498 RepID=A0ACD5TRD8_AVESA
MARWGDLPSDIVTQILARLPAAAVQRFRVVCSTWRDIIDGGDLGPDADGQFIVMWRRYRRRRPAMPLYFIRRNFSLGRQGPEHQGIARVGLHALDLAAREAVPLLHFADVAAPEEAEVGVFALDLDGDMANPGSAFFVEASCDGVLLLSYEDRFYLCNPATALWASLPTIDHDQVIVGFYAREPPGSGAAREYSVIYVVKSQGSDASYWIRELRALLDDAVYEIGTPMSLGWDPQLLSLLLAPLPPARQAPPILVRSILYWAPKDMSHSAIVLFDTVSENFSLITAPTHISRGFQLLDVNGVIAISAINLTRTSIEIWVRQDHEKEPWGLRFTVDLPERTLTDDFGYDPFRRPFVYFIGQEVHILLPCLYSILHWRNGAVRQLYQYVRPHHWAIMTPHIFEESLEINTFLLAPHFNDDDDHKPPFKPAAGLEEQESGWPSQVSTRRAVVLLLL